MKRIIEVSDTLYKTCIRLVSEGDPRPSECCIANSEPYEPQETGEWIDYDNTFYKCPECGYLLNKFCPQCHNEVILPTVEVRDN